MDYSNLFVTLMGLATVFIGLICIIILVSVMSAIVRKTDKAMSKGRTAEASRDLPASGSASHVHAAGSDVTPELVAAISAVIAEEMGTDVNALRIVSINKA